MRRIVVGLGIAFGSLLVPASAGAATLHGENGVVTYTAAPGYDETVSFAPSGPGRVELVYPYHGDPRSANGTVETPIVATGTCGKVENERNRYLCTDVTVGVVADGGDGDDRLWSLLPDLQAHLHGGDGNDQLADGNIGLPIVTNETFDGGPGDDRLVSYAGADVMIGGPGTDGASVHHSADPPLPVSITLDGVANDGLAGSGADVRSDVENVSSANAPLGGGAPFGALTIVGDAGPNELTGYTPANIVGGEGPDKLTGSIYDDTFDAADESADVVSCLAGEDSARVDGQDTVSPDCEIVTYAERVEPAGMTLRVKAARRARFTVTGQVVRPGTVPAQRACGAGRIRIVVKARKRKVATPTARLRADCSYRRTFAVRRSLRGKLRFGARYAGNTVLATATAKAVSARIRR